VTKAMAAAIRSVMVVGMAAAMVVRCRGAGGSPTAKGSHGRWRPDDGRNGTGPRVHLATLQRTGRAEALHGTVSYPVLSGASAPVRRANAIFASQATRVAKSFIADVSHSARQELRDKVQTD